MNLLTIPQARLIINATTLRRDLFFVSLLLMTGIRRGQALGLRHSDINTRERWLDVVSRVDNANGARSKRGKSKRLPIQRDLCRLYLDYMNHEYGDLDSDYVFVTLRGRNKGKALTFEAVDSLVKRLRERTGLYGWSCHTFRHTWATLHIRSGMRLEVISDLLMHGNPRTTAETYSHLNVEDLRAELIRTGCWSEEDDLDAATT